MNKDTKAKDLLNTTKRINMNYKLKKLRLNIKEQNVLEGINLSYLLDTCIELLDEETKEKLRKSETEEYKDVLSNSILNKYLKT